MGNVYIAINGDDVGTRIGNAIANDDHEDLASASSSIDQAHKKIDEWAKSVGGKKITGSGDEAIYLVPQEALQHMDAIRQDYQESSGHGLTAGVGASMSQASKALIYGKLNGKNQTIHYDPMIEDYLQDEAGASDEDMDAAPEIPEEGELADQATEDNEAQEGETEPEEGSSEPAGAQPQPAAPKAPEDEQADTEDMTNIKNNKAMPKSKHPAKEEDSEEAPIGNEDDVSDDNEEALNSPDDSAPANKAPAQKKGEVDGKTDEDFGTADGEQSDDESEMEPQEDADADMQDEDTTDAEAESESQGDESHEFDGEHAPEEGAFDHSDEDSEEPSSDDALSDMIHGDMTDEDTASGMPEEEQEGQSDEDHQELKQDIAQALLAFKDNKQMLEQAREQNPALYNATLTMLRSMISMAKKLGFAPEQDMQQMDNTNQMAEQMPEADDQSEEAPESSEEGAEEQGDMAPQEKPSEKK